MAKTVTDAMAAATVLGARLPMLWAMAYDPTAARRTEARRMVSEKSSAFALGALQAQQQMITEALGFWARAMRGTLSPFDGANAAKRVMDKGAAPARASMKANARRLAKRGAL